MPRERRKISLSLPDEFLDLCRDQYYGYVGGNPVLRSDPQGLLWSEAGTFTVIAAAAASQYNPLTAVASLSFGAGLLTYQECHPDEGEKCKKFKALSQLE